MTRTPTLTRRSVLGGVSAAALLPGWASAQASGPSVAAFAAKCRELTGFDPIPRALLTGVREIYSANDQAALVADQADDALHASLLKSLYTGMHRPEEGEPGRFAYSSALMYATVEDSLNVPSYCGGLPGFWAEKPADV